jgi:hypothetical protein
MSMPMIRGVATHGEAIARWFVRLLQYQPITHTKHGNKNAEPPIHARLRTTISNECYT